MIEAKFTSGEWEVHKYTSTVNGISRVFAYEVWSGNQCIVNKTEIDYPCEDLKTELLANAYLIAAAPRMYEYLSHMVEHDMINDHSVEREVKSLLAKACGE